MPRGRKKSAPLLRRTHFSIQESNGFRFDIVILLWHFTILRHNRISRLRRCCFVAYGMIEFAPSTMTILRLRHNRVRAIDDDALAGEVAGIRAGEEGDDRCDIHLRVTEALHRVQVDLLRVLLRELLRPGLRGR